MPKTKTKKKKSRTPTPSPIARLPIGILVKITVTAANYADGKVGMITGYKEGGYVVQITSSVPDAGDHARLTAKEKTVEVWAEKVEQI